MDYDLVDVLKLRKKSLEHDYVKLFAQKHKLKYVRVEFDEEYECDFVIFDDLEGNPFCASPYEEIMFDIDNNVECGVYEKFLAYVDYMEEEEEQAVSYRLFVQNKSN